jgi:hypothetical protein
MPSAQRAAVRDVDEIRASIDAFLKSARQPALFEPGEELFAIGPDNFAVEMRGSRLTLQAWDRTRNLTRRILTLDSGRSRIEMVVERFGKREGRLFLVDLERPAGAEAGRRSARLVFRERFRLLLRRQFPEWTLAELSAEPDLEHTLSPVYPRAFLRHGQHGWAAIACPPEADAAGMLSFGLIWLSYLRAREPRATIEGLALYAPAGRERSVALRLLCLNPNAARFEIFRYTEQDFVTQADPRDHGNLETRLEPCRRGIEEIPERWAGIAALPGVERSAKHDGRVSLRVRGIEFAEMAEGGLRYGLRERRSAEERDTGEIERMVELLDRARQADAPDRQDAFYRQAPEAWLESQARAGIETLDASLFPTPVYGQTPVFTGGERGVIDLLAVDRAGRLAVVELKASADLHLPLQALDYWVHVKWHLDRGEFTAAGYFPGMALRPDPPRLLLVSPSLEFHPSTETLLTYFSPAIEVERIGLGVEWRKELRVMFRLRGAGRPQ